MTSSNPADLALLTADQLVAMRERYLTTRVSPLTKAQAESAWVDRVMLLNHLDALAQAFEQRAGVAESQARLHRQQDMERNARGCDVSATVWGEAARLVHGDVT